MANFTYFEWSINATNKIAAVLEHWWMRPVFATSSALATGTSDNNGNDSNEDEYNTGGQWGDFLASEESNWTFM